jgi:hypothetical protein
MGMIVCSTAVLWLCEVGLMDVQCGATRNPRLTLDLQGTIGI